MKILFVSLHLPTFPSSGAALRMHYVSRETARHHEVHYVMLADSNTSEPDSDSLPPWLSSFTMLRANMPRRKGWGWPFRRLQATLELLVYPTFDQVWMEQFEDLLRDAAVKLFPQTRPDLLHLDSVLTMQAASLTFPQVRRHLDLCDLIHKQYSRLARLQSRWASKLRFWFLGLRSRPWEMKMIQRASSASTVNEIEGQWVREVSPKMDVTVVPNGVDTTHYQPGHNHLESGQEGLVFVGKMDYLPNFDAALFLIREVLPLIRRERPGAQLTFVGMNPPEELQQLAARHGVVVTGSVPDTRPYLDEAAVVLTTVRGGTGTRLKILEAMSMEKAIVSTSLGAEGLQVVSERDLLIADDARDIAQSVIRLLRDRDFAKTLARQARRLVVQHYDWKRVCLGLEEAYRSDCRIVSSCAFPSTEFSEPSTNS